MDCVRWHLNSWKNFTAEGKKRLGMKESEDFSPTFGEGTAEKVQAGSEGQNSLNSCIKERGIQREKKMSACQGGCNTVGGCGSCGRAKLFLAGNKKLFESPSGLRTYRAGAQ